jgi:N6-adenosine-specific RNA methylase IME4
MTDPLTIVSKLKAEHPDYGYRQLAAASNGALDRHQVRRALDRLKIRGTIPIAAAAGPLVYYETARQSLAQACQVDEILAIHNEAERIKLYAKQANDVEMLLNAREIVSRAVRRLGQVMEAATDAGQIAKGRPPKDEKKGGNSPIPRVTLEAAGITKQLAKQARAAAALTQDAYETAVVDMREKAAARGAKAVGDPIAKATKQVKRTGRIIEMRALAANPMLLPAGPFAAGIADPPWEDPDAPIGQTGRHYRDHYATMTPRQIADFTDGEGRKPADIFAPVSFLCLWVTDHVLVWGLHLPVLDAWGFMPASLLTWDKVSIGMGRGFVRNRTEHLVFAKRDLPAAPGDSDRVDSLLTERRTQTHSQKPLTPIEWIEKWYPDMSYVYLFPGDDAVRKNWCMWGKPHRQTEAAE